MPEFSYRYQHFYGFYRVEVRSDGTLIEWERDVHVLVAISSPLILVEKSVVKLTSFELINETLTVLSITTKKIQSPRSM